MKYIGYLMLPLLLFSCKTQGDFMSYSDEGTPTRNAIASERKVISSVFLELSVDQPAEVMDKAIELLEQQEGYVVRTEEDLVVMRIAAEKQDAFVETLEGFGRVKDKNITGRDVTSEYYDQKIRLENALATRDRFLALLDKANDVSAMVEIERELERLNETIELLKGSQHKLDHLSSYATVSLRISERKKPGLLGYVGVGIYSAVKWLFVRN